jgi:hypothetical protein
MMRMREFATVAALAMSAMTAASLWQSLTPPSHPLAANRPAAQIAAIVPEIRQVAAAPVIRVAAKPAPVVTPPREAAPQAALPTPPGADEGGSDAHAIKADDVIVPDVQLDKQADDVAERLRARVPSDVMRYFDVFLYVSKSDAGAWAQHMFIFHRADSGALVYEKNIPVSTGRERHEKYFTSTPVGLFELDPARFETMHYSHTWHGAPMAWAMFLNYTLRGRQVGIALHSAGPHIADLGHRASGGCVRLPPEQADILFHRFQAEERGMVPVWAFDETRRTTSNMGEMVRGPSGEPLMTEGYKVLLLIEDYPGGPALVAVLS